MPINEHLQRPLTCRIALLHHQAGHKVAKFSDQFVRFDPLRFEPWGPAAPFASALLAGLETFLPIGLPLSSMVKTGQDMEAEIVCRFGEQFEQREHRLLAALCDVDEFVLGGGQHLFSNIKLTGNKWEPFALLATWSLIDVCESQDEAPAETARLFEIATQALIVCAAVFGKSVTSEKTALLKTEESKRNIEKRWAKDGRDEHWVFAMELAPSIMEKTRMDVAERLSFAIYEQFKVTYTAEQIDGWLKRERWVSPFDRK